MCGEKNILIMAGTPLLFLSGRRERLHSRAQRLRHFLVPQGDGYRT